MKFIPAKTIMNRVTRHPLMKDIPYETVIDYIVDFLRIVGVPKLFLEKVADVEIKNYRGELPCDFYDIIQVRESKSCGDTSHKHAYRYSTDSFHMREDEHRNSNTDNTYKIQGNVIFTAPLKDGVIEVAYKAMPVDSDGLPLIPDIRTFMRALELFIKVEWFTILFDQTKIPMQVLQNAQQEYSWAVASATEDLIIPSIDQMESISNLWNRFIPDNTLDHTHGFKNLGTREQYKTH